MNAETSPATPTADALPVPPAEDQAGVTEQPVETAPQAPAAPIPEAGPTEAAPSTPESPVVEPVIEPADAEDEIRRLFHNLLHIFGKAEHWTAEEIEKAASWLKARL